MKAQTSVVEIPARNPCQTARCTCQLAVIAACMMAISAGDLICRNAGMSVLAGITRPSILAEIGAANSQGVVSSSASTAPSPQRRRMAAAIRV